MDRWLRKERDILDIKKLNPKGKLIAKKYLGVKRSRYLTVKIICFLGVGFALENNTFFLPIFTKTEF